MLIKYMVYCSLSFHPLDEGRERRYEGRAVVSKEEVGRGDQEASLPLSVRNV